VKIRCIIAIHLQDSMVKGILSELYALSIVQSNSTSSISYYNLEPILIADMVAAQLEAGLVTSACRALLVARGLLLLLHGELPPSVSTGAAISGSLENSVLPIKRFCVLF
jgi:hypothetical protein